jgi:hypothetical protein
MSHNDLDNLSMVRLVRLIDNHHRSRALSMIMVVERRVRVTFYLLISREFFSRRTFYP